MKCEFKIFGAQGGHSGDDIDKNRANANKILARFLYRVLAKHDIELYEIDGGNKRNAIAREAFAVIGFAKRNEKSVLKIFREVVEEVKEEFKVSDPAVDGIAREVGIHDVKEGTCFGTPKKAIDKNVAASLIYSLYAAPHGVLAMSNDVKGLVETSTNLASIKMIKGNIKENTERVLSLINSKG